MRIKEKVINIRAEPERSSNGQTHLLSIFKIEGNRDVILNEIVLRNKFVCILIC